MDNDEIKETVLQITKILEKRVEEAIDLLDNMNTNDSEQLKKQQLQELKQKNKIRWLQNGHGNYEELTNEKMFFDAVKTSENVVAHFFIPTNARLPIFDKHLKIMARKHLETRIVSLNVEKCPFLAQRLSIKVLPILICLQNGVVVDKIVGFASVGNTYAFSTEVLEWRLGRSKVIDYEGNLSVLPELAGNTEKTAKKTIRDGFSGNQSDDYLGQGDFRRDSSDVQSVDIRKTKSKTLNPRNLTSEEEKELGFADEA